MTTKISTDEVIARIDAERRRRPDGAIAFDADGTLWTGDVGDDFVRGFLARGRIERVAAEAMRAIAKEFEVVVPEENGPLLPAKIYDAYQEGRVPEERVCEMVAWACAGWTAGEALDLARDVASRVDLPSRLHPEVIRVMRWAQGAGIEAFVVSASPLDIVVVAVKDLGIDPAHVIAARCAEDAGVIQPAALRPIPYGEGKVTRLAEKIGNRPLVAAFGDNVFDVSLLRTAAVPVAVRPKPRLVARAGDVPGLVELLPEG